MTLRGGPGTRAYTKNVVLSFKIVSSFNEKAETFKKMSENGAPRDTQSETKIRKSLQEAHLERVRKKYIFGPLLATPTGENFSLAPNGFARVYYKSFGPWIH